MFLTNLLKKCDACNSPKSGVGVGKMLADITQAKGPEQRIGDRVNDDVAVGVGDGADALRDDDAAEDELPACLQAVDVVAVTDAEGGHFVCLSGD